ncbi:MAG: DUF1736 domain-containing protein [Bacteroidetes bacterium]|nr:DUF1736 domain-containing protein [Bacteroidota bacterium]
MSKKKQKAKNSKGPMATAISNMSRDTWFAIIVGLLSVLFYANTLRNHYALDDYLVVENNKTIAQGIKAIPEILTSLYTTERSNSFGYRPMAQISFAIEQQFTAGSSLSPNISHLFNVVFYLIAVLLLFHVLRRLLKNYHPYLPFFITVFFLAHPLHTEVVASLKNREVLLEFVFSLLAINSLINWVETNKTKGLLLGLLYYVFALLSKETAIAQLAVFPLVLYFFTDARPKQLRLVAIFGLAVLAIAVIGPRAFLPDFNRNFRFIENPLVAESNFFVRLSTAMYILGYYLKLLLVPYPMRYYYGYNMIPVTNWADPLVWLSLFIYAGLLFVAIKGFKRKSLYAFFILYFMVNMSMYANIVFPVPGIVAERFLFFASLSFAALLAFGLMKILRWPIDSTEVTSPKILLGAIIVLAVLLPYGYLTVKRNAQWRTQFTLTQTDIRVLSKSVKANDLYATELMNQVNNELAKPVNPYKFILPLIDKATNYYKQVLIIDSTHWSSWNNLGNIKSKIHASQCMLRYRSLLNKGDTVKAKTEYEQGIKTFNEAIALFKKALAFKPDYDVALFNIGYAFDQLNLPDSSIVYYRRSLEISPEVVNCRSRLANALYKTGQMSEAVRENMAITEIDPTSEIPYINLGNYYYMQGNMNEAVRFYTSAFEKSPVPDVAALLIDYYKSTGDKQKVAYYEAAMAKQQQSKK